MGTFHRIIFFLVQLVSLILCSPINGKKFETLSYLPSLTERDLRSQIDYMVSYNWTPCLEFTEDGDMYLNTRLGPCYYDNRYWSMYKLPMFGCTNSDAVLAEISACKQQFPNAKIRVAGFNSKKQVQCAGFVVQSYYNIITSF